jgi:hypothetical protein
LNLLTANDLLNNLNHQFFYILWYHLNRSPKLTYNQKFFFQIMMKFNSKKTFFTLLVCCATFIAKGQVGDAFSHYDVGFSVGFNKVYGDEQPQKTTPSVNFTFTYNQTPFTNFVFELQVGRMAGGDSLVRPGRQFTSNFNSYILRGQLQFGEFIDYSESAIMNGIKNFYVSAGAGYTLTHITTISRHSAQIPGLYTGGQNISREALLPLRIGYEFKFFNKNQQPGIKADLGYGYNYIFGDNLDGYTYGKHNDGYSQFFIGIKFGIGDVASYRKPIQH